MNSNISVKPQIGHYLVSVVDRLGVRIHHVDKNKACTCGGNSRRQCAHIKAVANFLKDGGSTAPQAASLALSDKSGPLPGSSTCPVCGVAVKSLGHDMWRCPRDRSHYWQWRGERNGGAVHKFLTQPHPAKQGAFYAQTIEEREAFLARVQILHERKEIKRWNTH